MNSPRPMLSRYVIPDMPSADELLPYLRQMDANRWYSNFGPLVTQFEDRLEMHLSSPDTIARHGLISLTTVITCYHALQIGLQLFHLPPQANVLVPAVTFPACPLAIQHMGACPVLADVDGETWQLTPQIARRVAEKMPIAAVMPVAVYGVPVPADEWDKFVEDTGIPVIIDAAAALETQQIPGKCLLAHSLHATKPFSIGEGGVLISRNADMIDEARCISNFGTRMRIARQNGDNAKMSEYHGAVALAQLDRWVDVKKRRAKVFNFYRAALIGKAGLGLEFQNGIERTTVGTLMLKTNDFAALDIADTLNANNIAAHRMYLPPLYNHPHFAGLTIVDGEGRMRQGTAMPQQKAALMTNSEIMQHSVFGVPFHAFMDESEIAYVIQALVLAMDKPRAKVVLAR